MHACWNAARRTLFVQYCILYYFWIRTPCVAAIKKSFNSKWCPIYSCACMELCTGRRTSVKFHSWQILWHAIQAVWGNINKIANAHGSSPCLVENCNAHAAVVYLSSPKFYIVFFSETKFAQYLTIPQISMQTSYIVYSILELPIQIPLSFIM